MSFGWKPYVPVAKRRANAEKKVKDLAKKGLKIEPVKIAGRKIATTFWGEAWCNHMEQFSDYANRLPRGRTYVRNGSVCHLSISKGKIEAIVSGSSLYNIVIEIAPLEEKKWHKLRDQCTGKIGSILELLQGKLSNQIMEIVTHRDSGLFPKPNEIDMKCNCPDWADLCKHLAAVLYGVGARLDQQPELLFLLRGVDQQELISAELDLTSATTGKGGRRRLESDDLSGLFGVDMDDAPEVPARPTRKTSTKKQAVTDKVATAKQSKPAINSTSKTFNGTGKGVAELRNRFAMNKSQFARLVGVTPPTISNWENVRGELNLRSTALQSLRQIAGMTTTEAQQRIKKVR